MITCLLQISNHLTKRSHQKSSTNYGKLFCLAERTGYKQCAVVSQARPGIGRTLGSHPVLASSKNNPSGCILELGGEDRIRTCESLATLHAFQACSFNHSDTSPAHIILTQKALSRKIEPSTNINVSKNIFLFL